MSKFEQIHSFKARTVDIERTDSGVGSESSQASSSRGVARRWRASNGSCTSSNGKIASNYRGVPNGSYVGMLSANGTGLVTKNQEAVPQNLMDKTKTCEDCDQRVENLINDRYKLIFRIDLIL